MPSKASKLVVLAKATPNTSIEKRKLLENSAFNVCLNCCP